MSDPIIEKQREMILAAEKQGKGASYKTFIKLSGPGWLQSAITLGGGSLAGSLYLGIIGGYELMWLQPLMMIFGIVMLSAIGYVVLSTGERPLAALNNHVNPVLGWGWAVATLMANMVWAMPQFSLGTAASYASDTRTCAPSRRRRRTPGFVIVVVCRVAGYGIRGLSFVLLLTLS